MPRARSVCSANRQCQAQTTFVLKELRLVQKNAQSISDKKEVSTTKVQQVALSLNADKLRVEGAERLRLSAPLNQHVVVGNDERALQAAAQLVVVFDGEIDFTRRIVGVVKDFLEVEQVTGIGGIDDRL